MRLITNALLAVITMALQACGSTYTNRYPVGETMPRVGGKDLEGNARTFPDALENGPAILLVGYEQNAQFDIDRWLLGLDQAGVDAPIYELPTIVGMWPGMFASRIDKGMRSGIPHELWTAVVTLYDQDADRLAKFLGNERGNNAHVLLVRPDGTVTFFHDRGYSIPHLRELVAVLEAEQRAMTDQAVNRSEQLSGRPN